MSDLSDPTALPDEVREAARDALSGLYFDRVFDNDDEAYDAISAVAPILAAHFAAELGGLRAQIEEAQALRNKPGAHKEHVLAVFDESPRGTVARIQAKAWAEGYSHCFECPDPGTSLDDNPYTEESQND